LPNVPLGHSQPALCATGTITMTIGAPISPAGKDPASLTREVEAWIENEVARLGVPE
jgi:hypothetical protein